MFFLSRRPFHVNVVGGFIGVNGVTRVDLESFSRLPCRLQNFVKASPMHEEPHFAADDIVVKNLFNFVFPSRVFELFAQLDRFLFELGHARVGVLLCNRALFAQKFLFALIAKLALGRPVTPFLHTSTAQANRFAWHASHTEVNLPSQHGQRQGRG